MKTRVLMILAAVLAAVNLSFAWGPKGHAVVADIAARHISKKTAQKIDAVLGGETMVDVSSWADNVRKDPRYAHTATWHFVNVDPGYTYQTMPKDPAGDVYVKLLEITEALKSDTLSAEQEKVNLMLLIHLVGDLHCPMHVGHRDDLGGQPHPRPVVRSADQPAQRLGQQTGGRLSPLELLRVDGEHRPESHPGTDPPDHPTLGDGVDGADDGPLRGHLCEYPLRRQLFLRLQFFSTPRQSNNSFCRLVCVWPACWRKFMATVACAECTGQEAFFCPTLGWIRVGVNERKNI